MLSYLANSVQPEIQMAVHQTARFLIKPMQSHKLAIKQIGRYLCNNPEGGIIYKIKQKGLKSTQMLILLEARMLSTKKMQTVFYLELALLFVMQTVR